MILTIQKGQNNHILRQKASKVNQITAKIKQLVLDMIETVQADDNSIGLAAPQVGQSLRIIVIKLDKQPLALINPVIKKASRRQTILEEGCLSLPKVIIPVKRPRKVTIEALNIEGQLIKIKTKDFLAHVIQHEIDHLDGILIIDKINE